MFHLPTSQNGVFITPLAGVVQTTLVSTPLLRKSRAYLHAQ